MDTSPFWASLITIFLAELGDKTQLATIVLTTRYRARSVFAGALFGICTVSAVSLLIGTSMGNLISHQAVALVCGAIFILAGIMMLTSREDNGIKIRKFGYATIASFTTVALMELGDKTQLSIIALAAKYSSSIMVFAGAFLAYVILIGAGVLLGRKMSEVIPARAIKMFAGSVFVLIGAIFLMSATGAL